MEECGRAITEYFRGKPTNKDVKDILSNGEDNEMALRFVQLLMAHFGEDLTGLILLTDHPATFAALGSTTSALSEDRPTTSGQGRQLGITESFAKGTKYQRASHQWRTLTDSVTRLLVEEKLPFNLVEKPAFKEMLQAFDKQYVPPDRKYFSKKAVPENAESADQGIRAVTRVRVRPVVRERCPMCNVVMNKRNIRKHIDRKHTNQVLDVNAKHHLMKQPELFRTVRSTEEVVDSVGETDKHECLGGPEEGETNLLKHDIPVIRRWWCLPLMDNFALGGHGRWLAHWAEEAMAVGSCLTDSETFRGHREIEHDVGALEGVTPPQNLEQVEEKRDAVIRCLLSFLGESSEELIGAYQIIVLGSTAGEEDANMADVTVIEETEKKVERIRVCHITMQKSCKRFSWKKQIDLIKAQLEHNLPQRKLITESPTRWGYRLNIVERVLEQKAAISKVCKADKKARHLALTWQDVLESLKKALSPLKDFTDALPREDYWERGFSVQKRIKSDIRSSLHPNTVEDLITNAKSTLRVHFWRRSKPQAQ
ncbi:unnamed protein product [Leuciscus chuanchicus]